MKTRLSLLMCIIALKGGCTFHAGLGGMGAVHSDGISGGKDIPKGGPSVQVGAGPCRRWPRLRASLTLDGILRARAIAALAVVEAMWIFNEGEALDGSDNDGYHIRSRGSFALKGRLAGGWNDLTNRPIVEAGIGLAGLNDSNRHHSAGYAGEFHAISLDVIATYAPDRDGDDETWIGGQLTYHTNAFTFYARGGKRAAYQKYQRPVENQSTDCGSGHLP